MRIICMCARVSNKSLRHSKEIKIFPQVLIHNIIRWKKKGLGGGGWAKFKIHHFPPFKVLLYIGDPRSIERSLFLSAELFLDLSPRDRNLEDFLNGRILIKDRTFLTRWGESIY